MDELFLKVDGIPGESRADKHKGEIELVGFSWGVTNTGNPGGGGGGAGRAQFSDLSFTKRVDKSSPVLFLACASGKHIKEAQLSVRKAGRAALEYLKIKLTDVLVTSFQETAGEETPVESVAFDFRRIDVEYTPQHDDGSPGDVVKAGWDLSRNTKV